MKRVLAIVALLALAACGRSFDVKTAPGFVAVDEQNSAYDFRAVAPDGVAVAVRSVPSSDGDVAFWEQATLLRMKELDGYEPTGAVDVKSADGTKGRELSFSHDEQGKAFVYRVRLFTSGKHLVVAEAGGAKDAMDRYKSSVDWMLASVRVN